MNALTLGENGPQQTVVPNTTTSAPCEVTMENFVKEVLEASQTQLVVVDFSATWCAPCKQFGPVLEKIAHETKGVAKLVKIDIEQCPQIAQQLRIQSVPAVFAFFNRQVVDGFMGALPEIQIRAWIQELIKTTGAKAPSGTQDGLTTALAQAQDFLNAGEIDTAHSIYTDILSENPTHAGAFAGGLRCLLALGSYDEVTSILSQASSKMVESKEVIPIRAELEIALRAKKASGTTDELITKLADHEEDHETRFDLALLYYEQGHTAKAIDQLLEIVKRNRKWHDDAARQQLVQIFDALGGEHPETITGRKKLSTVLFS